LEVNHAGIHKAFCGFRAAADPQGDKFGSHVFVRYHHAGLSGRTRSVSRGVLAARIPDSVYCYILCIFSRFAFEENANGFSKKSFQTSSVGLWHHPLKTH
jgi:hypothetical protein